MPNLDWSKLNGTPESSCTCRCVFETLQDGEEIPTFRSHAKFFAGVGLRSRKPYPRCGRDDNLRSVGTDWESG